MSTNPTPQGSRPAYERPVIVRHQAGLMNKYSRTRSARPQTEIDGVSIDELVETYGSPLFVFSERTLRASYRDLHSAMSRYWPKVRLSWSYKTNYLDAVCRIFHDEGAWAEVVSGFEYEKARHLGNPGSRIHFNGPHKPRPDLERALCEGALVHLDNFDELALAERIATDRGIRPGVAIRINLAAEGTPQWSRFGFNLESGQARDAARRVLSGGKLDLIGLHCHIGTFVLEPAAYRDAGRKLAALANELRADHGVQLDFIDLGGGFASHNTLKAQYLPGEQATPSFSRYAEAISDGLAAIEGPQPTLVLETGRALVDDAGFLVSTVQANKRLPDGRRGLVLDAGVNLLFTSFWYRHDVVPAQAFHGLPEPTVMYGPLCMNIDVVRDTMLFPPMDPGDRLVFRNVGAYNVTQWMQFITYRPPVVLVGENGKHALMRRGENLQSILEHEEVPAWLA
ncbi:MAG: diaminopimelate decarboxylase [Alphaproteobacteria bacterium]|nr:diaminopimelate decarboxylase [Alphaproteobacteria bacterium]